MLKMVDKEYNRKLHFVKGWSVRKISRQLGHARQTVRKMLADSEVPRYKLAAHRPSPVMDPYRMVIEQWLQDDTKAPDKQRHTARRMYYRLVEEHGFTGAESTVRRFVARLRAEPKEAFIPLSADWGEQAQVDWGRAKIRINGVLTEVSLFCLRMKASKVPFTQAFPTEKIEALLAGHRAAFEWLGGVPGQLVFDNPKTAVVKILAGPEREEHVFYSSLRGHCLFDGHFCNPGEGHEKGSVENLVGYVRRNAMVPVPDVPDLEALNRQLLA